MLECSLCYHFIPKSATRNYDLGASNTRPIMTSRPFWIPGITYVQDPNTQCFEDVMGQVFTNLEAAKSSCVADPRCGAV